MDLQRISDELEIATLLTRYARAVDSRDWDLYRSVFTDDAHIDYAAVTFARKWCGQPPRREPLRTERPIAHRRRRFRGHGCRARCMTPHDRGPAERIPVRRPWDW